MIEWSTTNPTTTRTGTAADTAAAWRAGYDAAADIIGGGDLAPLRVRVGDQVADITPGDSDDQAADIAAALAAVRESATAAVLAHSDDRIGRA